MTVSKAVLLAAGRGTRLGAITATYPKPLLDVGGRPIVGHILAGLARAGVHEAVIVTGHHAELLEADLGDGAEYGVRLAYRRQEALDGTARALALARGFCGGSRFFFGWGDILVRPDNYRRVLRASARADHVIAVNEVDDPARGAAIYVAGPRFLARGATSRVVRIVEKPPPGTSGTRWNNAGFGVLGPGVWPAIEGLALSERGEYELPRAIAALVESGAHVRAVPVVGPWFDIGTPDDLERAQREFVVT